MYKTNQTFKKQEIMKLGNYYENVNCESFIDKETGRARIRTIPCEAIPKPILVESLKKFRADYPIGTKFTTKNVKICKKTRWSHLCSS